MTSPAPPCVVPGCTRPGRDISNRYRTVPVLCDQCRQRELDLQRRPRRCAYCSKRRQCAIDFNGLLRCTPCFQQHMNADRQKDRSANSHALASATMRFHPDGTPAAVMAQTHCAWQLPASLEMLDGCPTYILQADPPVPLLYDPASATCESCRRNGQRALEQLSRHSAVPPQS